MEYVNGKLLYYAFVAGGNQILEHQTEINSINVFPVSDKDTGTNLAATIRSVIDTIRPHKSYKTTVKNIAEAALVGARGNSGVIFAQFLHGLNCETQNKQNITIAEFAQSINNAIPYVYKAISNPVEGTMLTVIRDWANFINAQKEHLSNFKQLLTASLTILEKSLAETTYQLKELGKTGFVDAGAKGFVVFIRGIVDFIQNRNIRHLHFNTQNVISLIHTEEITEEEILYRFCTEAIVKNLSVKTNDVQNLLELNGNSVVVAGSEAVCRVHVHTNNPTQLFQDLKSMGTITFQKVDDMMRQQETVFKRKWNIAIVTDSTCDLSQELIDYYQINVVPLNINFGDNHFLDKITIQPGQFYTLLDSEREFPKTSQINEQAFTNVYSHLASHYDAIIAIHLTSKFSGTYNSSIKAAKRISSEFNKPVHVVDSKTLSGSLGLLVLKAAQSIESGESFESVVNLINNAVANSYIYVSVRDLKYMIKGGRVSRPKGAIAQLLGLNPVISMDKDGKSTLFGNTFNQKSSLKKIFKHIEQLNVKNELWNYIILHAHNPEGAVEAEAQMKKLTDKTAVSIVDISPVIGMHAGNGAVAVSLLLNN